MKAHVSIFKSMILLVVVAIGAIMPLSATAQRKNANYKAPRSAVREVPYGFTGVGPVVAGSVDFDAIPSKAQKFLKKHCNGHAVVKCEKKYTSGDFEITLADGIEMEFDAKGNIVEIEAPDNYSLSPALLKAVVPKKLYNLLSNNGFDSSVEAVQHERGGYRMEVADPVFEQLTYDNSGVLTLIVDD
jgi:hypothetical protein